MSKKPGQTKNEENEKQEKKHTKLNQTQDKPKKKQFKPTSRKDEKKYFAGPRNKTGKQNDYKQNKNQKNKIDQQINKTVQSNFI